MFYRCNPFKNRLCGKRKCFISGGTCNLTMDERYSIDDIPLNEKNDGRKITKAQAKIKKRFLEKGELVDIDEADIEAEKEE